MSQREAGCTQLDRHISASRCPLTAAIAFPIFAWDKYTVTYTVGPFTFPLPVGGIIVVGGAVVIAAAKSPFEVQYQLYNPTALATSIETSPTVQADLMQEDKYELAGA
ncbi:hypothetical protein BKA64DRAFT_634670 [Cadophora sp. MPI-SDFR-AT-0126]|nr:hypothetical protein BKA64DRAFT_634670 [Leotiomycetes sp. MPI-SDFR-AT-0126]